MNTILIFKFRIFSPGFKDTDPSAKMFTSETVYPLFFL